jgi:predicted O-linked N-acetylglucosamine transferase (SPINDLY family)
MDVSLKPQNHDELRPMDSEIEQLAEAQRLKDSGKLDAADDICRRLLLTHPTNAGALHLCGSILHLRGQQTEAIAALQKAVGVEPNNANYLVTLGGNLAIAGRMNEATDCFRRAVAANPASVEAHYNFGLALKHRRDFVEAEKCFFAAFELSPSHVDAIANLGFVILNQGRTTEAKAVFCNALVLAPTHPLALTSLAKILNLEGNQGEAEALLHASAPNASELTLYNLAQAYDRMSNGTLANRALHHLVERYPNSAEAKGALAIGLIHVFQMAEAIAVGKAAVGLDKNCASAWCALGIAYAHSGRYEEAQAALTRTLEIRPAIGPRVMRDLMLPCIMGTREEVRKSRRLFEQNLDKLTSENLFSARPLHEIGLTYFYLAYHGENDIHLQKKIARFYQKTAPSLNFVAPHCITDPNKAPRKPIRVGFFSHYVSSHSVSYAFANIVESLNGSGEFEVYLVTDSTLSEDGVAQLYPTLKGRAVQTARDLPDAQRVVSGLELDILIYLDIGMDPLTFLLAFSRLAPIQCVMSGHPVTTGIPTIDYFLSAEVSEPPDAQEHYSEKLIRFKHGGSVLTRMAMPSHIKSRAELGLPTTKRIYLCPMTLQKIHPDFDDAVNGILAQDADGSIVFFESGQSSDWGRLLRERFEKTITPSLQNRIVFMPWILDQQDFICMIAQSDVVLDPFHFGIGTTGIHVFTAGTPLVTKPGKFMRGRVGYGFCKILGIPECISSDLESYIATAIRIAQDRVFREQIKDTILRNNHRLFENPAAAPEFANTLKQLAAIQSKVS